MREKLTPEERRLRGHLKDLTNMVLQAVAALDAYGKTERDEARGKTLAAIVNGLDMANDRARYFGLNIDYRKDNKRLVLERAARPSPEESRP
jgi:hypothetical protein